MQGEAGTTGNERITALAAALLLVLLAAEGVTILDLRPLFSAHVFIGALLIGPVALKIASTGYRFVRYYTGSPAYRRKGPPHPLMRMLAPPLVLATVTLFVSGVVLMEVDPAHPGPWVAAHKASFVVWFGLASVHVLVYVWRVPGLLAADWRPSSARPAPTGARLLLAVLGLAAGAVAAALLLPHAGTWSSWLALRH